MGGGMMLVGNPVDAFETEKRKGPRIQGGEEKITYTIVYDGPADGRVFTKNGATFPITLKDKDGNEYTGTCWMKLVRNPDGTYEIQMKIKAKDKDGKEIELDYDSKRDGGKPANVKFNGLRMTITADIACDNAKFNENMGEGMSEYVLATNPINGTTISKISFDKHPPTVGVFEGSGPIQMSAQLKLEHAGADYIGFTLSGMAGQSFDASIYDVRGNKVRTLGSGGLRGAKEEESLQFDLNGLASGTYFLMVTSERAKINMPFVITQ